MHRRLSKKWVRLDRSLEWNEPEDFLLEAACSECCGAGVEKSGKTCEICGGSGFVPTALGERVLALIAHNRLARRVGY